MTVRDPLFLPCVGLAQIDELPPVPGIYFAVENDDEVVYIGQSYNIRARWVNGHHRMRELSQMGSITIHYVESDGRSLFAQEADYIRRFCPKMNSATRYKPLPQKPIFLFYIYMCMSVIGVIPLMLGVLFQTPNLVMIGGFIITGEMIFWIGGMFTWWYVRRVLRAKIEKERL